MTAGHDEWVEDALRAHYRRTDSGPLAGEIRRRVSAVLRAEATTDGRGCLVVPVGRATHVRLGRGGASWSVLAAAAVLALAVISAAVVVRSSGSAGATPPPPAGGVAGVTPVVSSSPATVPATPPTASSRTTPLPFIDPTRAFRPRALAAFGETGMVVVGEIDGAATLARSEGGSGSQMTVRSLDAAALDSVAVHEMRTWVAAACREDQGATATCRPAILRSDDGGATWTTISSASLESLTFGDDAVGFAIGWEGIAEHGTGTFRPRLMKTADGGGTWADAPDARPCGAYDPVAVSFVSATHGWVACAGVPDAVRETRHFLETADGGRAWVARGGGFTYERDVTVAVPAARDIVGLSMTADGTGVTWCRHGGLLRTKDGGWTWMPIHLDAAARGTVPVAVSAGMTGAWFAVAPSDGDATGRLYQSDDRGATWTAQPWFKRLWQVIEDPTASFVPITPPAPYWRPNPTPLVMP